MRCPTNPLAPPAYTITIPSDTSGELAYPHIGCFITVPARISPDHTPAPLSASCQDAPPARRSPDPAATGSTNTSHARDAEPGASVEAKQAPSAGRPPRFAKSARCPPLKPPRPATADAPRGLAIASATAGARPCGAAH